MVLTYWGNKLDQTGQKDPPQYNTVGNQLCQDKLDPKGLIDRTELDYLGDKLKLFIYKNNREL